MCSDIENVFIKKFPDTDVGFYLSHRSNFVHMGLEFPLCSLKNHLEFVKEIHEFLSKGLDSTCFQLVDPQLVLTVKWKYDYIIVRKIKKRKMSNLMNSYVQDYVSSNLKWYEHDSLLTQYDECKWLDFLRDTNNNFKQGRIINFDIIHRTCWGEEIPESLLKEYQTLSDEAVSKYPESDQNNILSSAFRTDREDIYF